MRCVSFSTAKSFDLATMAKFFKSQNSSVRLHRNVLHVAINSILSNVFFFTNGCFVTWGLKKKQEDQLLEEIRPFSIDHLQKIETDYFSVKYGLETKIRSHERSNIDIIELDTDSVQLKLAISYGLAQSVKLEAYEEKIQMTIRKNTHIVEELAQFGKISLPRKDINRRMGEIFLERASINLKSEYIDVPEYFWEHPSFEVYYTMTEQFLDVPRRVAAINHKLDVLHDIFQMLTAQLEHRYSAILEYIVILLIFIEVLFSFKAYFN